MRIPTIRGIIDRRVLVNFRVDPQELAEFLPPPFRPQLVRGNGVAGICLIRLKQIRPNFMPAIVGIGSENAAHRIAVEWDANGQRRTGVFIPRRDTSSRLNAIAGGRIFPGIHHRARFDVAESAANIHIVMHSLDDSTHVWVDGVPANSLPADSIFASLEEASQFFEAGCVGYSPHASSGQFDGLELRTSNWHVEPLAVTHVESSFFADRNLFPASSTVFDHALLMRGIDHQWHACDSLCAA